MSRLVENKPISEIPELWIRSTFFNLNKNVYMVLFWPHVFPIIRVSCCLVLRLRCRKNPHCNRLQLFSRLITIAVQPTKWYYIQVWSNNIKFNFTEITMKSTKVNSGVWVRVKHRNIPRTATATTTRRINTINTININNIHFDNTTQTDDQAKHAMQSILYF